MKKILASDYDDTFYRNDEEIAKNIKASDEFRKNGNVFVIASGRTYKNFKKLLNNNYFKYNYLVINHGATTLDENDNIIENYSIDNQVKNYLCEILEVYGYNKIFACKGLEDSEIKEKDITKIGVIYNTDEKAYVMSCYLNEIFKGYINCYFILNKNMIEIVTKEADKASEIKNIAQKENVKQEEIYTIGDSYNDIEMIKKFNGYAMPNAVKEVKKVAVGEVDGVYKLISKM